MDDLNFAEERRGTFRGLARVALSALNFKPNPTLTKHVSDRNIDRLVNIFELEGCQRAEEQHFLTATVPEAILASLLAEAPNALLSVPCPRWIDVPFLQIDRLDCLAGRSRIRAAERYLTENDQWWVVKIYSDDIPSSNRLHLAEDFLNEQAFSDGEIFFKIRHYHKKKEPQNERKWWARLTDTKRKDLRQLLKDDRYAEAFDALLDWPGLWAPIKLGSLHRLLSLKCDEELLNYLRHVNVVWKQITAEISPCVVDNSTVESLQTLAPLISTEDAALICRLESDRQIFPRLIHDDKRAVLRCNLLSVQHMIPSLHTFFEDIKYLEPCAKVMRDLFSAKTGKSIRQNLMGSFFQPAITTVEYACSDWRNHIFRSSTASRELGYQQLWLFAVRNFPQMTNATTRKDQDKHKPVAIEPSPIIWQKFGEMAFRNGFKTKEIVQLKDQQCFSKVVSQLFKQHTNVNHEDADTVKQLASALGMLQLVREPIRLARFTATTSIPTIQRSGRPFEDDHGNDRGSLYLPQIYRTHAEPGPHITTFYRKWVLFRTFFNVDQEAENFDAPVEEAEMTEPSITETDKPMTELARLQQEVWSLQAALKTERENQKTLQDAYSEMQRSVEQNLVRHDRIECDGRELAAECATLRQKHAFLQREVEDALEASKNAEAHQTQSVKLIDQLRAQLIVAQECTNSAQTELKFKEREAKEAKEQYKLLERQSHTELHQLRVNLESAEYRLKSEIDRMKVASEFAEDKIKSDQSRHVADWARREAILQEKIDKMHQANQQALIEISQKIAENKALQETISQEGDRVASREEDMASLTKELDTARSTIVDLQNTQTAGKSVLELLIDEEVAAYDTTLTRLEDVGLLVLRDCRVSESGLPISNDYFVPSTLSQGVLSKLEVVGKGGFHYSVGMIRKKIHPSDFTAQLSKPWQMERVLWRWSNKKGIFNHSPFQEWQDQVDSALHQGLAGRKRDAEWLDTRVAKRAQKDPRKANVVDYSANAVDESANFVDQGANVAFASTRDDFVPE